MVDNFHKTGIVIVIVMRGASSLNLAMFTQTPEGGYYLAKGEGLPTPLSVLFVLRSELHWSPCCSRSST
jgi:hypothetical protein